MVLKGSIHKKTVRNNLFFLKSITVKNGHYGQKQSKSVKNSQKSVKNSQQWLTMGKNGHYGENSLKLSKTVKNREIFFLHQKRYKKKTVKNGQHGQNWSKKSQIWSTIVKKKQKKRLNMVKIVFF